VESADSKRAIAQEKAVVTIYVESNEGHRLATGNGLVINPDGLIATEEHSILRWLEAEDNTVFVRTAENVYYPIDSLIALDSESGVAVLRINATGLKTARLEEALKAQVMALLKPRGDAEKNSSAGAINEAKERAVSNPGDASAYLGLGVAYKRAGMDEEAFKTFKQALRARPDYAEAYHGLGVLYARKGMYEETVEALRQAVRIRPDYAEAHGNLGFVYDFLGRHEEAVASFMKALRARPDYAEAYNGLGVSYAREGMYLKAIHVFEQALRIKPEFGKAHFNLGLSYLVLGDEEAAMLQHDYLEQLDPELAERLYDLMDYEQGDTAESGSGI
jgi:tetratricopeptide (TPR) repeat protein